MKLLGLTESDWANDVIEWSNIDYSQRNTPRVDPRDKALWSTMAPVEQFALLSSEGGYSDQFHLQPGGKTYIADALRLSEAGRLAYIDECIRTSFESDVHPVEWATCQPDIDALDGAKLAAELAAATSRTAYERMTIRRMYAHVKAALPAHAKKVQQLLDKDPAYGKLFELAKQTRAQWNTGAKDRAALLALVLQMDDARASRSKKALAGCSDMSWKAYVKAVGAIGAKRFERVRPDRNSGLSFYDNAVGAVLGDIDGYLSANALVACDGDFDALTCLTSTTFSH